MNSLSFLCRSLLAYRKNCAYCVHITRQFDFRRIFFMHLHCTSRMFELIRQRDALMRLYKSNLAATGGAPSQSWWNGIVVWFYAQQESIHTWMPHQPVIYTRIKSYLQLALSGGIDSDLVVILSLHSRITKHHQLRAKEAGSSTADR